MYDRHCVHYAYNPQRKSSWFWGLKVTVFIAHSNTQLHCRHEPLCTRFDSTTQTHTLYLLFSLAFVLQDLHSTRQHSLINHFCLANTAYQWSHRLH